MNLTSSQIEIRLSQIFSNETICAEDRRYALALRGIEQADIARRAGYRYHTGMVSEVISGKRIGKRIRRIMAELIGIDEERLFPA